MTGKNKIEEINFSEDIKRIVDQSPITLLTSYRGKWCPFCRQYLSELNRVLKSEGDVLIVGVSVDNTTECQQLAKKLKLEFDLIPDENLVMRDQLDVKTGKGHGKEAYLQPAVFLYNNGELVFQWVQTPKMLNFGGAINRLPVQQIFEEVQKLQM